MKTFYSPSLGRELDNDEYRELSIQDKIFVKQDIFDSKNKTGTAEGYAKAFNITVKQAEDILCEWESTMLALSCGCDDFHIPRQIL